MPRHKIVFDVRGMIDLFGRAVYKDAGAVVRELLQNGNDAILELAARSSSFDVH